MIEELRKKWDKQYAVFPTKNKGIATVNISDASEVGDSFATIFVEIDEISTTAGKTKTVIPIGMPPVKQAGGMLRLGNTFYSLTNGLIQRDGFYIVQEGPYTTLQFIRRDRVLFKFQDSKNKIKLVIQGGSNRIDTCGFLIGLDVFDSRDEFNYYMADIKHFFSKSSGTMRNKEDLAKSLFYTFYGPSQSEQYSEQLNEKSFKSFFGSADEYLGKTVFFSFSRFIGSHLVSCNNPSIPTDTVLDENLALIMDRKKVTNATIIFDSEVEETVEVDWSASFTEKDLLNAIRLMVLRIKYPEHVSLCDTYALYNKVLYTYYDYVSDYIYDRTAAYIKSAKSNSAYSSSPRDTIHDRDFKQWVSDGSSRVEDMEKGLSIVSANNSLTFEMNKNKFTKDLLRKNIDTIMDEERYLHQSYFGWVNPFITSDSKKVGLTGSFIDAVDITTFTRPFSVISSEIISNRDQEEYTEEDNTEISVRTLRLTPLETYNQIMGIVERDGSEITLLNGKIMDEWGRDTWDIYCNSASLEDKITEIVPGLECDQAKRYRLSNKAITQSLPMCSSAEFPRKGVKNPHEERYAGKTAEDILIDFADTHSAIANLIKSRGHGASRAIRVLSVSVGKYTSKEITASYEYDDKQDDTYYITMLIDGIEYVYRHPRFIQSPSENARLYFTIRKPSNGSYYNYDEVIITSGRISDVGQECNVMYGSFDGYTYEDGVIVLSDFVARMGLTTKLHFTETIEFEGELIDVRANPEDLNYLDSKGLPKIGTFIRKGDVICKICTPAVRIGTSQFSGFVEGVKVNHNGRDNRKNIKIYLSDIKVPSVGDKLGNGHGNKGVVVRIVSSESLYVTGELQPDIVINPLGTLARMNIGQIKEMIENTLSMHSEERIVLQNSGYDTRDIKSLYQEMHDKGLYQESYVIYNGMLLGSKAFVAPMVTYRMKQHSQIHLKSSNRPNLNVNHIASNGQRMSVLNTTLYSAYGCQEALQYMLSYQSRTAKNSIIAENMLVDGVMSKPIPKFDTSILRSNAMHLSRGQKLTSEGPAILLSSEVENLQVLGSQANALINKHVFGEADPRILSGYQLVAKIKVGGPIIMPAILYSICSVIPYKYMYGGDKNVNFLTKKQIDDICHYNRSGIYLSPNFNNGCINLYAGIPPETNLIDANLGQGYFALIEIISTLSISSVQTYLTEDQNTLLDEYISIIGYDLFSAITLDGVPVAPINLRPTYKGLSGQSVDSLYRNLTRATSPLTVYDALCAIDKEFGVQLYQHNKTTPKQGEIAHGEKTSEYIDSIYARRYGYSGRSVATFDNNLDIFEISLPFELFYTELEPVVKEYLLRLYASEVDTEDTHIHKEKIKRHLFQRIDETVKGYISDTTYDKSMLAEITETLIHFANRIACGMTREPTLRRQNHFWYTITFHRGHSIKTHTAICSGYNLDYDGDAVAQFLCLCNYFSNMLLEKMSPYEGIFDYDSGEIWIKPMQDSLLGLYKLTKYNPAEEISRIYTDDGDPLLRLKRDVQLGLISIDSTIMLMRNETQVIKQTVGNIILLLTIRKDALLNNEEYIDIILNSIHGGMTSDNNGKFVETLLTCDNLFGEEYWDLVCSPYFDLDKFRKLRVLRDIINLGYEFMTITGVTLKPSIFGGIRTAAEVRQELGYNTTSEFDSAKSVLQRLRSKIPPIYTISSLDKSERDVQAVICDDINANSELADIFNSGCRGKIGDFLKVCDMIGKNVYGKSIRTIQSNYSKGLTYMDKMLLAQPDRKAVVNQQVHLGEQGATLQRSAIVSSSTRITESRCGAIPTVMYLDYDVFVDGNKIASLGMIQLNDVEDIPLLQDINSLMSSENAEQCGGYPAELVGRFLVKHERNTFQGKPLTFKLKQSDRNIISSHYIVLKGQEYAGNTQIDFIEASHPASLGIYTLYNCETLNGICKHCYGLVPHESVIESFSGNVGINVVFSVGQQAFQNTLDASKSTSGDIATQAQSMLTLFQSSAIVLLSQTPPTSEISITYNKSKDSLKVIEKGDTITKFLCKPPEVDVYFKEHDVFLPKRFINFLPLQCKISNEAFEYLYFNMLRILSEKVTSQQADTILSTNMRFVKDGKVIPLTRSTTTKPRYWVTSHALYSEQDPLVSPLLPDANERFTRQALTGKKFNPSNVFSGVFSFEDVDTIIEQSTRWSKKHIPLTNHRQGISRPKLQEISEDTKIIFNDMKLNSLPDVTTQQFEESPTHIVEDDYGFDEVISTTNEF